VNDEPLFYLDSAATIKAHKPWSLNCQLHLIIKLLNANVPAVCISSPNELPRQYEAARENRSSGLFSKKR